MTTATFERRAFVVTAIFEVLDDAKQWRRKIARRETAERGEISQLVRELTDRHGDRHGFEILDIEELTWHPGQNVSARRRSIAGDPAVAKTEALAQVAAIRDRLRNGRTALADLERSQIESEVF